ncbi:hypothetical protein SAMD00023378_3924 [Ralstonia sp. NT80]|uniref:hypothetical protein n=1 Tax=Ralstonia sp. NT80 TaxID=1218247 RepID=UPI00066AAC59|nr:hypothetical protein [Ralstonia sp. NT80]GAQ30241.1 hypothetical protein SAMD00023378_3924 [Ralstonia sp. NT80]
MADAENGATVDPTSKVALGSGNVVMIVMGPVFIFDEKAANMWRQAGTFPAAAPGSVPPGTAQGDDVA